ncbi:MAG: diguanylate cyclase [Elusimicrobiota bacterium]
MNFDMDYNAENICSSVLNKYKDIDELIDIALKGMYSIFNYDRIAIFIIEYEAKRFVMKKVIHKNCILEGEETFSVKNADFIYPILHRKIPFIYTEQPFLGLYFPLESDGRILGLIRAEKTESRHFDREHLPYFKKIAAALAEELHKYNMHKELVTKRKMLKIYRILSEILVSTLKTEGIIRAIVKEIQKNFLFDNVRSYLYDKKEKKVYGVIESDFRNKLNDIKHEIYSTVDKNSPVFTRLVHGDKNAVNVWENMSVDILLRAKNKNIGVLRVHNLVSRTKITEENISFLKSFANQIGVALKNTISFDEIRNLANTDSLTGLYSKRHFKSLIAKEISRAERFNQRFALIVTDINQFKKINDTHGHQKGDEILVKLAGVLKKNVRDIDLLCRYGGDEFLIYLANAELSDVNRYFDRIISILNKEEEKMIKISAGVAIYPNHGLNFKSLFEKADKAMYRSKKKGDNILSVCDKEVNA